MEYTDKLKNAINTSHIIPKKQKPVLQVICKQRFPIPASEIEVLLNLSRPSVNFSIRMLLNRGFIKRLKEGVFMYYPAEEKMKELIYRYETKTK